jgi:hypothetical protein
MLLSPIVLLTNVANVNNPLMISPMPILDQTFFLLSAIVFLCVSGLPKGEGEVGRVRQEKEGEEGGSGFKLVSFFCSNLKKYFIRSEGINFCHHILIILP